MIALLFSTAKKIWSRREKEQSHSSSPAKSSVGWAQLSLVVLSILVMIPSFVLSFLCIYAGSKPGFLEEYAIFTLNTSRIGQNLKQELDDKIMSIHIKRSESLPIEVVAVPTLTATPTTLVTLAPRIPLDLTSDIDSQFGHLTSEAGSEVHHATKKIHSKVTSAESDIKSHATSALGAVQTEVVQAVNKAFNGIISELDLEDFYSVHLMKTCSGGYVTGDGANITVGEGPLPDKDTHKSVGSCGKHAAIDPTQLILVVYWISVVFTSGAFLCAVSALADLILDKRKIFMCYIALGSIVCSGVAFCILGLASAVTHGIAVGAGKLVNFVGDNIGVAGYVGRKFLAMTWATTVLLLINTVLWAFIRRSIAAREEMVERDPKPVKSIPLKEQISYPQRAQHIQRENFI